MQDLLDRLALCIERGKSERASAYPPEMQNQDGASEITIQLLNAGVHPNDIVRRALMAGMNRVGEQFAQGQAFIPQLLISARAMKASMVHLRPFFESGVAVHRGTILLGTAAGDLHDIGKNIVGMVMEGDGWQVVDLGVDVSAGRFVTAVAEHPQCVVGLSALLTTTMGNMRDCVAQIKASSPATRVYVGGAPVTEQFSRAIGADGYFPDPGSLAKHLAALIKPCEQPGE
jgi:5-methyltetrahydrofolate--homocysteine methyltransferase